ncbi:hypothetical protein [Methylovirgula sp. HY1]|uniref:hypothetical protein n=1 Tax=Methylovirgula sp. HY1 TaxID=2822761 RepID=UPI001C5AFBC3|nr:hypothetical protein [Methylovirgula sp. HY1]QXX75812.1 hypothetical protein MHY1_02643 [Methylovirgula sp. HY1]
MRYLPLILIVACVTFTAQPGPAAARSIKDCETIKAADAYNLCLASFGPVAHERDLKPVPAGVGSGKIHRKRHHRYRAHYRHHSGVKIGRRGRHKRKQMQLSVGPSNSQD